MSASNTGMCKRGIEVLHDPRLNKSTAFSEAERQALGLVGLVPDVTEPIETQLFDNVTWVRGRHAFKAGAVARAYFIDQTRGAGNPFGIYPSFTFSRTDTAFSGLDGLSVLRPDGSRVNLTGSGINSTDRNNLNTFYNVPLGRIGRVDQVFYSNGRSFVALQPLTLNQRLQEYSAFVQDDWRVTPRLTLNLGLRYELNTVPYDKAGVQVAPDKPLDGSQGPVTFEPAGPGTGACFAQRLVWRLAVAEIIATGRS